jgi:glycolate oxidase FAD binding subunit
VGRNLLVNELKPFAATWMNDSIVIDGVGPMTVERPTSVAELCAIVRRCADTNTAIYPVGGGTMLDYGMPPARPGIALSTTALNQIIDYPARDLTITVQAGITMQKLQETLAAENQWLPIDVPGPETATIGGAIACDVSGPRRYGYGTLRDYIIGITVVNDRGEETHAGGRVVKNVAGYDMMKLHTGALGTLGVITQVTLKVKPRPDHAGIYGFAVPPDRGKHAWQLLNQTATRPVMVKFHELTFIEEPSQWVFHVVYEGGPNAVAWQLTAIETEIQALRPQSPERSEGSGPCRHGRDRCTAPFDMRVRIPSGSTFVIVNRFMERDGLFVQGWNCGTTSNLQISQRDHDGDVARALFEELFEGFLTHNGTLITEKAPKEWKCPRLVWGRPPADLALQKAVKRALDPQNIFNPGRFVTDAFV